MTVIAWDGQTLAADKRLSSDNLVLTVTKIRRVGNRLVGVAGDFVAALRMLEALEKPPKRGRAAPPADDEYEVQMLVIERNKPPMLYFPESPPVILEEPFAAIGSGRDLAVAAMHCGKSAVEAVEIACLYNSGCGNGIDVLTWETRARKKG